MDAVHRYEGTVNKVMGDGIMALFGAPIAWRIMPFAPARGAGDPTRVAPLAEEARSLDGVDLRLRIGLNSGQVIAGDSTRGRGATPPSGFTSAWRSGWNRPLRPAE